MHKKSDLPKGANTRDAPRSNWLIIFLVWAAGLGAAAQFGKVAVALDEFRKIYAVSEVSLGFLISCVGIVGLFFGVVAGILIPRVGIRRAFILGMFGAALLSALQAFQLPYLGLVVLRIFEGASHLSIVVAGPILMARHSSDDARSFAMTLWSSFFGLSYMLVAILAPVFIKHSGVSGLFLAHAGYMFVIGLFLSMILPKPTRPTDPIDALETINLASVLSLHVKIYRSAWLSAAALGFVFYTGLYIALLSYLPGFVDALHRTGLSATLPLASIVTSLTIGVILLRYVDPVHAVIIGFACIAIAAPPLYFLIGNDGAFVVGCIILLASTGIVPGASFAALATLNTGDTDRAYATGAIAQLGNVGTTCGPPILAAIISSSGIGGTVAFVILFCCCGIGIHLFLARRRRNSLTRID